MAFDQLKYTQLEVVTFNLLSTIYENDNKI